MSNDLENEYFCEGISEEIIHALTTIEQLKVISRNSSFLFKNQETSIREVGKRLDVQIILQGSVRVSGRTLRIAAQLVNVNDESQFWSQTWDRNLDNIFEIQDEVSLLIADKLREHAGHLEIHESLVDDHTHDVNAYQYYLKGRFHVNKWNPEDIKIAISAFETAVAIDANLINGYLGLADAYSFLAVAGFAPREEAWFQAKKNLQKAQKIDPNHAGLNYLLANQAFFTEANYARTKTFILKSLQREPTHADAQGFMSLLHVLNFDFKNANDHIFFAKSIDPINPEIQFFEANLCYRMGQYDRASKLLDSLLSANPKNLPAIIISINIKIKNKNLVAAKQQLLETPEELFTPDERLGLLCLLEILTTGPGAYFSQLLTNANDPSAFHAHAYLYLAYANMGRFDEAFQVLENVFTHKSSILLISFSDPLAESIQQAPQYQSYRQRLYPTASIKKKRAKKPASRIMDEETVRAQLNKLLSFIDDERPFLNPELSLRLLAKSLSIHPNQLSWLINEYHGKNFNEFINQKRIEHFKTLVVNPKNSHISLIGLAYESGFNSKTVFNTVFKKEVGMTPSQYQKSKK